MLRDEARPFPRRASSKARPRAHLRGKTTFRIKLLPAAWAEMREGRKWPFEASLRMVGRRKAGSVCQARRSFLLHATRGRAGPAVWGVTRGGMKQVQNKIFSLASLWESCHNWRTVGQEAPTGRISRPCYSWVWVGIPEAGLRPETRGAGEILSMRLAVDLGRNSLSNRSWFREERRKTGTGGRLKKKEK